MTLGRRRFVGIAVTGLAGACASLVTTPVRPVHGKIRVSLDDLPGLAGPRGSARLRLPETGRTIYILALPAGGFAAVSPICKHQGCTVEIQPDRLSCPCHGSQYGRDGRVLRGPTQAPLDRFPVSLATDRTLIIDLGTP